MIVTSSFFNNFIYLFMSSLKPMWGSNSRPQDDESHGLPTEPGAPSNDKIYDEIKQHAVRAREPTPGLY